MMLRKMVLSMAVVLVLSSCSVSRNGIGRKEARSDIAKEDVKADTAKKGTGKPQPYNQVITNKAVTDAGLFKIHKVEDKYYFEIPDSLLERDILISSRISKAAVAYRPGNGFKGYNGDEINSQIIRFSKGPANRMFMIAVDYGERSVDSTADGMFRAVKNSNVEPIVASFDVKAFSPDSSGVVIDMTDQLNNDNECIFYFSKGEKASFKFTALQKGGSYIKNVSSLPLNIEIAAVRTYTVLDVPFTYEVNASIVLLGKDRMKPRYFDKRVGYFTTAYLDFDTTFKKGTDPRIHLITRWRLEPKKEDIPKYLKGELVEPQKPIVYYIDPATPKKWVPYLIQGVNDWQKAFERAGFKNAIYALEAPVNDPEWSLYDARHNAIVYKASVVPNASGPHINDPFTGEILETHVNWYHNVTKLLQRWYFVQASPNDPGARKMDFDDSLMGQLIRFVVCHEVGHTLGLRHNMGASSTVPVEKLRDKKWVEENGHTPSIMDYARFNYVAQPEDNISEKGIMPRIGVYDEWAIEWGYRWFPDFKTIKEEKAYMHQWVTDRVSKDKRLWFGGELIENDPRIQTEAVGDNAMKAGAYGIKNLQRVMVHLTQWTKQPYELKNESLAEMREAVIGQYRRYLLHVVTNIGGIEWTLKSAEEKGHQIEFTSREKQKEAIRFLQEYLFTPPVWLLNNDVFLNSGGLGVYQPLILQEAILKKIISHTTFLNLTWFEASQPDKAYTFAALLRDLEAGIFRELINKNKLDIYARNLQKAYIEQLTGMIQVDPKSDNLTVTNVCTDVLSVVKGHMGELLAEINRALPVYREKVIKWHLEDLRDRLVRVLEENKNEGFKNIGDRNKSAVSSFQLGLQPPAEDCTIEGSCWDDR